jgi:ATP-dependent helicase Lhr and Lhr-like helicase
MGGVPALSLFHPVVRAWFARSFDGPTRPQTLGWPAIARGDSTLLLAPTGSGKTLAAFLWCIDRLMFAPLPPAKERCRILYVSPLKALAVDVERNLRAPIAGIATLAAEAGHDVAVPAIAVRTGDTPAAERARFAREPADILITTPESLYLLLTSNARAVLRSVDTVVVDEIHALVPTKRGAHLAVSLERLETLAGRPLQRIGLSATQRPLDEVARFLGGATSRQADAGDTAPAKAPARSRGTRATRTAAAVGRPSRQATTGAAFADPAATLHDEFSVQHAPVASRPVTIVDAGARKALRLRLDVPVENMARLSEPIDLPSGPAAQGPVRPAIWTAIHPRLLAMIAQHRSTLIFVNSRRIAERLAGALNELAGSTLVRAHHGSLARAQRVEVEDSLKAGTLRGLVATSSLELGIDMGAIDLVVQIEAPPSVASGLQRIGRAGHHVGATSDGLIVPKYRHDLVACAAVTRAMHEGAVEATRYPRNPLDVLAQQVVAMAAMDAWQVDDLFATLRRAAPFADLSRGIFEGVLDMLSGRYPSDDFAELRPRITWDRLSGRITARENARRVAVINGGTIPDRGLYGVFLLGAEKGAGRVGELDEEMVFESRAGETFVLGASTWRIEEITHDRVLVSPAPGEPGKVPFWRADAPGRPLEFGRRIGALVRSLSRLPPAAAIDVLVARHDLAPVAAENLVAYLQEQRAATEAVPDDRTIVIERCRDELGDWRVCLLSPLGGQVLAPWAMAAVARIRDDTGLDAETMWTDDGFVVRFPDADEPPDPALLLPAAEDVEGLVLRQLGSSALFAAKFREAAARALLLPRRRPGHRTPLWQQRKRASDLLAVAARFGSFPMLLEAYRECLRDVFDMPALQALLGEIGSRALRVVTVDSATPSPFASSLLFRYVATYLYDGDAPLAERRAQALAIDQAQLRELLGEAELRELLDTQAIADVERQLQRLEPDYRVRSVDALHDLLLRIGDLSLDEVAARAEPDRADTLVEGLVRARRAVWLPIAGARRLVAVEDAARYRDGLGIPLPAGIPGALLAPVRDPRTDLVLRYARTHGPFTSSELAARFGTGSVTAEGALHALAAAGRLLEGDFRPGGTDREWCDPSVLASIRRRSLARLRHQVEPVEPRVLARFVTGWQGTARPRRGLDALLDAVEHLQGAPLAASLLESEILPARVEAYSPADLDVLLAEGEVVWAGLEPLGERDGRLALYLTDHFPKLWRPAPEIELGPRERAILDLLARSGASFFAAIHEATGGGYPGDTVDALWTLVWHGVVGNDSLHALRAFVRPPRRDRKGPATGRVFRSRRASPPAGEGRWGLLAARVGTRVSATEWSASVAQQLLSRYGIVTRQVAASESIAGGFSALYDVFRSMEERGRIRRGYFAGGVGAMQFALPAALERLRSLRIEPDTPEVVRLAASDPANPYGTLLKWPASDAAVTAPGRGPTRAVGASVILVNGTLGAHLGRHGRQVLSFLPDQEPDRSIVGRGVASKLAEIARRGEGREGGLLVAEINGQPAASHPLAPFLLEAGFVRSALGFHVRREVHGQRRPPTPAREEAAPPLDLREGY